MQGYGKRSAPLCLEIEPVFIPSLSQYSPVLVRLTLSQDIVVRYVFHTLAFHHWSVLSISAFQVSPEWEGMVTAH